MTYLFILVIATFNKTLIQLTSQSLIYPNEHRAFTMKCPRCRFENPENSIFCLECGEKMELKCPECGRALPILAKFCNICGHDLRKPEEAPPKDLSFEEKLSKIQKYLPKGLTEKILSQKDRIEGERKQVTVMFCDMEGFTQLSERLGPEKAYTIMDQVYEILIHKVHDYEGTVNEFTGDGIMALFGAPIALEDAPLRAIRSAYGIHREMTRFSDRIKKEEENIPSIKMRIGIHTGPVVVGTLGNDLRLEFKAVGNTVNLASRMEKLAEPGSTYVMEDTFRLTEGLFRFEDLGEHVVKGKADTVKVYRVIAPSTRRTRFDVSAEQGLTPFVGRERELQILLDGVEKIKRGGGLAISIVSEAGVGKSRLLYEFRKRVISENVTFLEGKCLSYSRIVAYHPVIDILKSNFYIQEGDGDSEIRKKVKRGLEILGADEAFTLPYLLQLLSVEDSDIDKTLMSPEARKYRIIDALKRIVIKGSEIRPLIMAFEDLHWIDQSSEDVLKHILDSIPRVRVMLIFTYRLEFVHSWGAKSFHNQLNLNRLSNRESFAMLTHLLGTEHTDRELDELILEKTEGIPFFIEEFIRSLKDLKLVKRKDSKYHLAKDFRDATIPATIQDLIMARVDSLPAGAKELLQTGSVIEREFSYKLIKRVTGFSEQKLISHLSTLKDSELIYERGIYPETAYIFRHALTREVVYDSILTTRKKKLHERIGDAIEEIYRAKLDEHYVIIAKHYIKGGNYEKGAEYSFLAGKKAEKAASFPDAIVHAEQAAACIEKLPQTVDAQRKLIDARTFLGLYYNQIMHNQKAKEAVDSIFDLALKTNSKKRISQIYCIIGTYYYWVEEDFTKAFNHLQKALEISEEVKDNLSSLLASYYLGVALYNDCEFKRSTRYIKKANQINVAAGCLWGISIMKSTLSYNACNIGDVNGGCKISADAVSIAEESGDIYSKAAAYISHGISFLFKGFLYEAVKNLSKGADFSRKMNHFYQSGIAHDWLGESYFELGEYQKSTYHYREAITKKKHGKLPRSWIYLSKICLERAKIMNNQCNIDLESLYRYEADNKIRLYEGWMRKAISEILLNIGGKHISAAEVWLRRAIEADKRNGTVWFLGRDYALYSELLKLKDSVSEAKRYMKKAIEAFDKCGADGWREKAEKRLTLIS